MAERIDVYPVGILADLLGIGRSIRARHPQAIRGSFGRLRWTMRYLRERARANEWRAFRNSFNGYLAEDPTGRATRCGHGWTKKRALRDLYAHLAVSGEEQR